VPPCASLCQVGVSFVLASYCVCLSLALLSVLGFACAILLAFGVVLFYVTTANCLWLLWRYGLSPLYHSCRVRAHTPLLPSSPSSPPPSLLSFPQWAPPLF
jgi:hypothetical protein